jgi:ParB family chromosome partitioning protein
MLELALIENIQREDLNAIERADAYRRYADEFGLSPEQIGSRMGEDRTTVVNYLRLLELPAPIRRMVAESKLSMGHARCLAGVSDVRRQSELAESVISSGLSVRALEGMLRRERSEKTTPRSSGEGPGVSAHIRDMEQRFERAIKTKVSIIPSKRKGRGRIVIEYYTLDDFDRLAAALGVEED